MALGNKNIVFIGFMACGKTMISREVARRLGMRRVSTDELIEEREGLPITQIFARSGEAYFRRVEAAVVKECAALSGVVIDCGGGVAMNEENMQALNATGVTFYLNASPEAIYRRTKGRTDRPLLNVPNPLARIKELLAVRDPHYRKAQHVVDSSNDDVARVAHGILLILDIHGK